MLASLTIQNYALIDRLQVEFAPGFNVLTGETGAGKSIIVGSLGMVLGERASADLIRSGEEKALVEASFDLSQNQKIQEELKSLGFEVGAELILTREISASGKNQARLPSLRSGVSGQARLNGRLITQTQLKEATKNLIDIHGQHEHQSLLNPESHVDLLDALGGKEGLSLRQKIAEDFGLLEDLRSKLNFLEKNKEERERQIDFLKFQIKEIDEAELQEDEEENLRQEKNILSNASKLTELAQIISHHLTEEGGISDRVKESLSTLKEMGQIDKNLLSLKEQMEEASIQIEEIGRELRAYQDKIEFSPERLAEVEDRLDLINQLKRKYARPAEGEGNSIAEINNFKKKKEEELKNLSVSDEQLEEYKKKIDSLSQKLKVEAEELSLKRRTTAKVIERKIKEGLANLNMGKTGFKVDIQPCEAGSTGVDRVEFLISPNPGEPLKPLARIASGGELSRIMLALKSILVSADEIPTMIFDEIDVGIGGQAALKVGERLAYLGKGRQVICVTHLPQIASQASTHFFVGKRVKEDRTLIEIKKLNDKERVAELARMLSGRVSEKSLKTAEELLSF